MQQKERETKVTQEYIERIGGLEGALEQTKADMEFMQDQKNTWIQNMKRKCEDMELQRNTLHSNCQSLEKKLINVKTEAAALCQQQAQKDAIIDKLQKELSASTSTNESYI